MLVYYISSHGFGHAVRSCEVIRQLPAELPLTIKTAVPEQFLREELGPRPFDCVFAQHDCGVLGPDSSHADLALTFERAEELERQNAAQLATEAAWLRQAGARLVAADIVPFALRAARAAGLPSVLLANFTWPAIYSDLLHCFAATGGLRERGLRIIAQLQSDFDAGDLLLETEFAIPMRACARRERIGLISRRGVNRREAIKRTLGLDAAKPIYLIYLGADGLGGMQWERLPRLNGQFIAYSVPPGAEPYVRQLPRDAVHHADAAASVDAVISKPGYGLCAECMAAGTPLLFVPRPHFSEADAIAAALDRWGGAIQMDLEAFKNLDWAAALSRLASLRPNAESIDLRGGAEAAHFILDSSR